MHKPVENLALAADLQPAFTLPRDALLDRIDQRRARLVVLRAPPGFGKTTLLAQLRLAWARAGVACALLHLEPADNDVSRFVARLWAAVEAMANEAGDVSRDALADGAAGGPGGGSAGGSGHAPGAVLAAEADGADRLGERPGSSTRSRSPDALLRAIAGHSTPFALLMDDAEHLREPGVLALLRELLVRLPDGARLVLSGRGTPELGLGRLRAGGDLLELELDALRFSEAETRTYIEAQPLIELPPGGVAQLHRKAEGWPAGLAMAASVLQRLPAGNDFMRQLCASDQVLAAYLREAVLDQLSYESQQLLLRASVLRVLEPGLCEQLLPGCDAGRILRKLAAEMFLITPVPEATIASDAMLAPAAWRMHALFADVLRDRLTRTQPDLALRLHLTASGWYESSGRIDAAVDHALAGGDVPHAVGLLSRHADTFIEQGRMRWLARGLGKLPPAVVAGVPALRVAALWAETFERGPRLAWARLGELDLPSAGAWERAHLAALRPLLLAMLDRYEDAAQLPVEPVAGEFGVDLEVQAVSVFAEAVRSNAMAHVWSVAGAAAPRPQSLLDRARGLLTDGVGPTFAQGFTEAVEGLIDLHEGRLIEASARLRLAAAGARGTGVPGGAYNHAHGNVWAGVLHAVTVYETGQLTEAASLLHACQPLVSELALPDHLILTLGLSARIAFAQGEAEAALALLRELEFVGLQRQLPRVVAAARLEMGWLRLRQGQALPARDAIDRAAIPGVWERVALLRLPAHQHEDLTIARARWTLSFGGRDEHREDMASTRVALAAALDRARISGDGRRALKLQLLLAVAQQLSGDWASALAGLRPLMSRLAGEGYRRLVLDEGALALPLLRRLQGEVSAEPASDPVGRLASSLAELIEGIEAMNRPTDSASAALSGRDESAEAGDPPSLTPQEVRVLQLLAQGCSNGAMAQVLQVSDSTVRTHLRSINLKLGAHSRGQALAAARRWALIA
ncbi:MAG: AAA family ATPase [Mitsuaria chitosanitabida]|uniref:LuxR C-terminal-related transcriptional regulator n=1 Tax=Roseateles chitosanitabidus TaxID=65048 RepID=UPI001B12AD0F|nr:LuxR C-terminal-related transcriptional regulator [Roseateles chitosanitabidus]MBO9687555.1 AAA family ATPase [Roseateles chitosanitabidus]